MSQYSRKQIDWKSMVPNQRSTTLSRSNTSQIKSYLQELAGHEILVSVICNDLQDSICHHFFNYLQSGDLFWFKHLKQATHVNLSLSNGKIKLLFKQESDWKEVLIDLKRELDSKYQENIQ